MNFREEFGFSADEFLMGFFVEIDPANLKLRRANDSKLVVHFTEDTITFYDPAGNAIYHIFGATVTEADEVAVNARLDAAWGEEGFAQQALLAIMEVSTVLIEKMEEFQTGASASNDDETAQ